MSLSLVGIIAIQAYYINDSVDNENERFNFNVVKALNYVSNTIEENESEMYFSKFFNLDSEKKTDEDAVSQLLIYQKNNSTKETLIYRSNVLEENYKLSSSLFDIGLDSLDIKNIIGSSSTEIYSDIESSEKDLKSPITI